VCRVASSKRKGPLMKIIERISREAKSAHLYAVEVKGGEVHVEANNSSQAMRIAERKGYDPRSVNMIG
jgi:hypothetical protein